MNDSMVIERLYDKYAVLMYRIAFEILKDKYSAEDAVQDSFEKISKYIDKIDNIESKKTRNLMAVIAKNAAIDIYNSKNNLNYISTYDENDLSGMSVDPLNIVMNGESIRRMVDEIVKMKPLYADVLLLYEAYNYSTDEIADLLQLKRATVKKRIQRAKKILMKTLSESNWDD